MEPAVSIVDKFQQLYTTRETFCLQQAEATEVAAALYGEAIDAATKQLTELALDGEVQDYLTKLGGAVVRGLAELEQIDQSGLIDHETVENKRLKLDKLRTDPLARMAIEFLAPQYLPEVPSVRPRRFASPKQIEYAKSLGLDVTSDTPQGLASKMITNEVRKRSRAELRTGWQTSYIVSHPGYGQCEIVKIHEKIGKVTMQPLKGGKKFVVAAMYLGVWSKSQNR